jgi:hypothetical protein
VSLARLKLIYSKHTSFVGGRVSFMKVSLTTCLSHGHVFYKRVSYERASYGRASRQHASRRASRRRVSRRRVSYKRVMS